MSSTTSPLPIELLRHILSYTPPTTRAGRQTLSSFSQVSKSFNEIAKEDLYEAVCLIHVPSPDRFLQLTATLRGNERLARRVRALKIRLKSGNQLLDMEILQDLLELCPNLEELYLKSMDLSPNLSGLLAIPKKLRTVYLRACTIHHIYRALPRRRYECLTELDPSPPPNSITSFSIASCDFNSELLAPSAFKSLRTLSLSSRVWSGPYISFLRQVLTKLEALKLCFDEFPFGFESAFATQDQLRYLELGRPHQHDKDFNDIIVKLATILQPSLSTLRIAQSSRAISSVGALFKTQVSHRAMLAMRCIRRIEIEQDKDEGRDADRRFREDIVTEDRLRRICARRVKLVVKRRDKNADKSGEPGQVDGFFGRAYPCEEFMLRDC